MVNGYCIELIDYKNSQIYSQIISKQHILCIITQILVEMFCWNIFTGGYNLETDNFLKVLVSPSGTRQRNTLWYLKRVIFFYLAQGLLCRKHGYIWPLVDSFADVPAEAAMYKWISISFINFRCHYKFASQKTQPSVLVSQPHMKRWLPHWFWAWHWICSKDIPSDLCGEWCRR